MKETYLAQGMCYNCGRRNYPQWGTYEKGKRLEEYPCPKCGCMTWILDSTQGFPPQDSDVGKTNDSK